MNVPHDFYIALRSGEENNTYDVEFMPNKLQLHNWAAWRSKVRSM
jgi:hypothetical protein